MTNAAHEDTNPKPAAPGSKASPADRHAERQADRQDASDVVRHYDTRPPKLSLTQRVLVPVLGWLVWLTVRILGPTIRFEIVGGQLAGRDARTQGSPVVLAFWHCCIAAASWCFRNRQIVLLNTTNFDGQWTRRVIERLGYQTAQGSSTRGGLRGLAVMVRQVVAGHDAAFTVDGPRGPRYIAKPGPAMLARRTGRPIVAFHIGLERAWVLSKTWDLFQIPRPFTRAVLLIAPPIDVPVDSSREALEQKHAEMQLALEKLRDAGNAWFAMTEAERQIHRDSLNAAAG